MISNLVAVCATLALLPLISANPRHTINRADHINQIGARIDVVANITAFQAANPDLKVTPLNESSSTESVGQQIVYVQGARVVGDSLVSTNSDSKTWPRLQDVTLNLSYPSAGVGAVVTFVQVIVNQSSNVGRGYVIAGGIGQRFIHLVIEAHSTSYFSYNAQIYGYF